MGNPVETKIQHHWLLTFLPRHVPGSRSEALYLLGYCKGCGQGFTQRMKVKDNYEITTETLDVPEWGCKSPFAN